MEVESHPLALELDKISSIDKVLDKKSIWDALRRLYSRSTSEEWTRCRKWNKQLCQGLEPVDLAPKVVVRKEGFGRQQDYITLPHTSEPPEVPPLDVPLFNTDDSRLTDHERTAESTSDPTLAIEMSSRGSDIIPDSKRKRTRSSLYHEAKIRGAGEALQQASKMQEFPWIQIWAPNDLHSYYTPLSDSRSIAAKLVAIYEAEKILKTSIAIKSRLAGLICYHLVEHEVNRSTSHGHKISEAMAYLKINTALRRFSTNMFRFAQHGLGFLLGFGESNHLHQKNSYTEHDVEEIMRRLDKLRPGYADHCKSLGCQAAELTLIGMLLLGFTLHDLRESQTDVMRAVRRELQPFWDHTFSSSNDIVRVNTTERLRIEQIGSISEQLVHLREAPSATTLHDQPWVATQTLSADARKLFWLFLGFGTGDILLSVIQRGTASQQRWGRDGERYAQQPQDVGIEHGLCFWTQARISRAVQELFTSGYLCSRDDKQIKIADHAEAARQEEISGFDSAAWSMQAFLVICHSIGQDRECDESFGDAGRAQTPYMRLALEYGEILLHSGSLTGHVAHTFSSAMLSASYFMDKAWKLSVLSVVDQVLHRNTDAALRARAYRRRIDVTRLWYQLDSTGLDKPLDSSDDVEPYLNGLHCEILLSRTNCEILQGRLDSASAILDQASERLRTSTSAYEQFVEWRERFYRAKIACIKGKFEYAKAVFPWWTDAYSVQTPTIQPLKGRPRAMNHDYAAIGARILCENGEIGLAEMLLREDFGLKSARPSIEISCRRRVSLTYAEVLIEGGKLEAATSIYTLLQNAQQIKDPTAIERMNRFRICVGQARISYLSQKWLASLDYWEKSLKCLEGIPGRDGFLTILIYLSMALAHLENKDKPSYLACWERVGAIPDEGQDVNWFLGFGMAWKCLVSNRIAHLVNGGQQ